MTAFTLIPVRPGERHPAAGRIPLARLTERQGLQVFDRCDVRFREIREPATGGG